MGEKHKLGRRKTYRCAVRGCKKAGHTYERRQNVLRHLNSRHPTIRDRGEALEDFVIEQDEG
jgi:hypothetical protein